MTYADVTEALQAHMNSQPYEIKCAECGAGLDCASDPDSDGDLRIEVTPCLACLDEARTEAKKEAGA